MSAFTVSCNTAFIGLTVANLDFSSLHDAALIYHVGDSWNPGFPVYTGSVPVNNGQTDFAASAIGQLAHPVPTVFPPDLAPAAAGTEMRTLHSGDQSASNGTAAALASVARQTKCRRAASCRRRKHKESAPAASKTVDLIATEIK